MKLLLKLKFAVVILSIMLVTVSVTAFVFWKRLSSHSSAATTQVHKTKALYTCPMHPGITSDHPDNCPICHMALKRVDTDTEETNTAPSNTTVPGRAEFTLSHEKQQLIGVTTAKVERKSLGSEIRATGRVAFDPDLYTAVEEYRQAVISRSEIGDSPYEGLLKQSDELIASSKTKLKLMGLTDAQIKTLSSGKSSHMGLLLPKGTVWVYTEIFEYEMALVKIGQTIEATSPSVLNKVFLGTITSVSPILNAPTRTVRVLSQVPDPQSQLRPDTFLNVKIKINPIEILAVPQDSVLHSGDLAFVFVVKGQGKFQPRAVSVGRKLGEFHEIFSGLEEGEYVVTAANFLIDSESRLRSALQNMESAPSQSHQEHSKH